MFKTQSKESQEESFRMNAIQFHEKKVSKVDFPGENFQSDVEVKLDT